MKPDELFAAALEIPDLAERAAFLERECAGDPSMRAEVESLLAAHAEVVEAGSGMRSGPGASQRRQQQARQDRNDRNDSEQLDQSETEFLAGINP